MSLVSLLIVAKPVHAAPTFQAAGTAIGGAGAVTPTWPTHAVDDIALLFIESRGEEAVTLTSNAAGFVAVANSPQNTGTTTVGTRLTVYWTRATSTSMANPTVGDPGNHVVAQILTYRGVVNTGNPWDVTGGGVKATASTAVSATGVTTTVPDTLVVVAVSQGFDATSTTTFSGWANANLTSINERADFAVNNGDGGGFGVMDGVKATAGATGNTTATMSNSFANAFLTIALKLPPPTVSSINRASTDPTLANTSVSWTVVFSKSVTGVNTADFALVQSGGVTGASITSVVGSGTTWTVTANTGTGTVGTLGLNLVDDDSIVDASNTPLGGAGAGNGNFTGQVYTIAPTVISINTATTNPATEGDAVSWTVTFSASVTGVNAADFTLAQAGGVTGASISSVTGSGTTWTVTANSGTGAGTLGLNLVDDDSIIDAGSRRLGGTGAGNGNFTGQVFTINLFCSPPSNVPAGVSVSCVCDRFGRASLNPSTIFGSDWIVSKSDSTAIVPYINATTGNLRLTENTGNNAKAATVPGIFPAAGNYISVEFQHYSYGGSGADGIAVTLSDYSVPAVPGAFGGSLGYAQKTGAACPTLPGTPCPGFAGGWIGVAIDEFGNYQNPTEGRIGGPGSRVDSVGVRGSGSDVNGYNWMAGTATLNPQIDNTASATPAPGYYYQVIVDARNDPTSTSVQVNRDTGSGYSSLISVPNVYTAATAQGFTQNAVPVNWQISFTGSTGGSTNVHEISGLRICAQTVAPPTGGTASGFSAIDEAYPAAPTIPVYQNFQTGHVYTKLSATPFKFWVAALTGTGISTAYSTVSAKFVAVKLVDNSVNVCGPDSARTCNSTCTNSATVEAGASQIVPFTLGGPGASLSPAFTLNTAWKNLVAVMKECTTSACTAFTATAPACSVDSFSVRPVSISSVTSSNAVYVDANTPSPIKTGANFNLTATVSGVTKYTGAPKINSASVQAVGPATVPGVLAGTFASATDSGANSTAKGDAFTYSDVGGFRLLGPDFAAARIPGVYDDIWTAIDSNVSKNDCITGATAAAYSNTKDANGKYGCNFGIVANTDTGVGNTPFGRFIPDHFALIGAQTLTNRSDLACASIFTYLGEPFRLAFQLEAQNATNAPTKNYVGAFAKLNVTDGTKFGALTGNTTTLNSRVSASALGSNAWQASTDPNPGRTNVLGLDVTVARKSDGTPDGAFDGTEIGIAPADTDGVALNAFDRDWDAVLGNEHKLVGTTNLRYGRLQIANAFGSELTALPVPMRVQYYTAASGFITNGDDSCTSVNNLTLANLVAPVSVSGAVPLNKNVGTKFTTATIGNPTFVAGDAGLSFSAPGSGGSDYVDVTANLGAIEWLKFDWDNNGATPNTGPTGRATFGLYKGSPRNIYLRERY